MDKAASHTVFGWPTRSTICLDCRTTYPPGTEKCEGGKRHRVVQMGTPHGNESVVSEIWGPPSKRRRIRETTKAGGTGAAGGGVFDACSGCEVAGEAGGEIFVALLIIVVAVFAVIAIYFLIKWIVKAYLRYKNRPKPKGALNHAPRIGHRSYAEGIVEKGPTLIAPLSQIPAVAFTNVLLCKRFVGSNVMFRDSATLGFTIRLDSGEVVQIPAGKIFLEIRGAADISSQTSDSEIEGYLQTVGFRSNSDLGIPWDFVKQVIIGPGQRVVLRTPIEPQAVGTEHMSGYREAAQLVYKPTGTPRIALRYS